MIEPPPSEFTVEMAIAVAILVVSYLSIFTEVIHRTSSAIIGAVVMIAVGMVAGFYSQELRSAPSMVTPFSSLPR